MKHNYDKLLETYLTYGYSHGVYEQFVNDHYGEIKDFIKSVVGVNISENEMKKIKTKCNSCSSCIGSRHREFDDRTICSFIDNTIGGTRCSFMRNFIFMMIDNITDVSLEIE